MTDFLILTDREDKKRLVAIDKIIYVDYYTGGGSRLALSEGIILTVKESVEEIIGTMRDLYNSII